MDTDLGRSRLARLGTFGEPAETSVSAAPDALLRIERALERIRRGEYGYCACCKGEISLDRLESDPAAQWCEYCDPALDVV